MPKSTKRIIDATPCPERGQVFLRDDEIPGFALRLTPGSKTFVLEKRIHGRMRRISIGPFGPLTAEQARTIANEYVGRIAKGEDPAQDRLNQKRELTFSELADLYLERHALSRKRSSRNDVAMIKNHLIEWKNRKLSSIARSDVVLLHAKVGQTAPYAANRLLALIRKMFNLARVWGMYRGENPATGIERFPEEKRDRFVQPQELPALMQSLAQESNPFIKASFLVCLFTGARKMEVLSMKWSDIDIAQGIWRIPQTKASRPHLIPLPAPILSLLHMLPRFEGNPHVFPGRKPDRHLVNVSKAWGRLRKRAGIIDVRVHDLRRTLGSWLAGSNASLPLIGKILNHSQPSTTAIYARLHLDPVRAALEANAKHMIEVGGDLPSLTLEEVK